MIPFADKDDAGWFLSAWNKTYLSWIVYRVSATSGYFNADVAFVIIDPPSFPV